MSLPPPASLLRHRPPALLLAAAERVGEQALACRGTDRPSWPWSVLLEGAAQAAGLLAGLQPGGPTNAALVAEYRAVHVHTARHQGAVFFHARVDRRVLHFWRCRVEARDADGALLLAGLVSVARPREAP